MHTDDNTEVRIKETARKLFQEKGFEAVRTREIAEAAGINSALLHYYFRTKEKLFHIIMVESIGEMFLFLRQIINDPNKSLSEKIDEIVNGYIDVIRANPNLALFVLNELNSNSTKIIRESGLMQDMLSNSLMFREISAHIEEKSLNISPLHIMINTIALSVMPHIAQPLVTYLYNQEVDNSEEFLNERRRLIPLWIKGMLQLDA